MSLHPRNVILALVLAALVAANAVLARDVERAQVGRPLFAPFDVAEVARIVIAAGDADPVVVERGREGGWIVATRDGFPAFEYAAVELCAALARLARGDRVGEEPAAHALFGVGAEGTRITLQDARGRALAAVVQGTPRGLATGSYVRLAAGDEVYRAPAFAPVGARAEAWLDTRLVDFAPSTVRGVAISYEGGRVFLDLLRDAGGWRDLAAPGPEPAYVSRTRMEHVLHVASTLVFSDVIGHEVTPAQGFGSPPETLLELDLEGDERRAIWIGLPVDSEERAYHATNPYWPEPWTVSLPAATAEVLFAAIEQLAGG